MHEQANKYFWLLGVVVVIVCSTLAASATNHYIEATYLLDTGRKLRRRPVARPAPRKPRRNKRAEGTALVDRNPFCSACKPPEPEVGPDPADGNVPLTSLPLRLVATSLAANPERSFATIRNTSSEHQGAYWLHQEIPEAGPIEDIGGRYVDFRNENTKRLERIALLTKNQPAKPSKPRRSRRGRHNSLTAAMDQGIKKVDSTHYEVDRALVDKLMSNPMAVGRGARIVPSVRNGKANGFKLYAIRRNSLYAKLGLKNGDTVQAVNGFELTTPDKVLEVYTKVKEASNLSISMTRRGKPLTLNYNIR